MDSCSGGCGTCHDLQVVRYDRCQKGDVSGRWCVRGRQLRFQLLDQVKLCNKGCCFIIFTGHPPVSEGMSDSNDLFDLADVHVTTVNIVVNSGNGGDDGLVDGGVVGEWDSLLHSAEWCMDSLNWGTSTWNCWYGGCNIFLIGVIELTGGGLVGVWEVAIPDADEGSGCWVLYV